MSAEEQKGYNFGTFKGVFTPSILTILGVIMYLRFGWVLGNVGLPLTIVIVTLSTAITFFTALALSSLATNMRVGGGGAYYIISRSLGIEAGAAVGLPLFFAQALGISFYVAGFSESIVSVWPFFSQEIVGVVTLVVLAVIAYRSADLALKMQFLIMTAIVLSLVSFFFGSGLEVIETTGVALPKESFWIVFAVFFPAVTGIEAGIAMSGDLKNPARSLPLGTLGAIFIGYLVYLAIPVFLDTVVENKDILLSNNLIMKDVAFIGEFILIGLWGAALSSAMGALLGAPRTLQALANDGVLPRIIGKGFGENKDPRIATIIAFSIGLLGVLLGDLNLIAPVLSMFFLTSYGFLNISAGFEELISGPSWRPKFKVPWKINFIGALACFAVMFMINAGAAFIAIAVSVTVYYLMERRSLMARWGDMRYGILMLLVQYSIRKLRERRPDEKTWKPNILVLSGSPTSRWYLIELANAISRGRSLMTVATVLSEDDLSSERIRQTTETIQAYLKKRQVESLVKVMRADDMISGLHGLIRAYGFGPLTPNTILLGETEKRQTFIEYARLIETISHMKRNLVIVRGGEEKPELEEGSRIDIWWSRKSQNAGFMLALAYQLRRSSGWQKSQLYLKTAVQEPGEEYDIAKKDIEEFISKERLDAIPEVIIADNREIFDAIKMSSQAASIVFLGMRSPQEGESHESYSQYYEHLLDNTDGLPPTAIVSAAENVEFQRIFRS